MAEAKPTSTDDPSDAVAKAPSSGGNAKAEESAKGGGAAAMAASATPSAPPPPGNVGEGDDDMLLVTEFPPPPYYYPLASRSVPPDLRLSPPEIPHRAFRVAAKRVKAERKKMREESERMRLEAEGGGDNGSKVTAVANGEKVAQDSDDDDSIDPDDPNEPVVAVFGEIVEDPTLVTETECDDPIIIRENVKRLNRSVLEGFLNLVKKLVDDPTNNKKLRDELSHNIFLMLTECNKFREHQAREILIDALERQLERRKEGLEAMRGKIRVADEALAALDKFREAN